MWIVRAYSPASCWVATPRSAGCCIRRGSPTCAGHNAASWLQGHGSTWRRGLANKDLQGLKGWAGSSYSRAARHRKGPSRGPTTPGSVNRRPLCKTHTGGRNGKRTTHCREIVGREQAATPAAPHAQPRLDRARPGRHQAGGWVPVPATGKANGKVAWLLSRNPSSCRQVKAARFIFG